MSGPLDILGTLNIGAGLGGLVWVFIAVGLLGVIATFMYITGRLDGVLGRYKTKCLCFEKRQGRLVLIGIDRAWSHTVQGDMVYSLKQRKININPPELEYIHTFGGENVVFLYFPNRTEAHPFNMKLRDSREMMELAIGKAKSIDKATDTAEELLEAYDLLDDEYKMSFEPVVDESSLNLVTTQLQKNQGRYETTMDKLMRNMPVISTAILMFVIIIGFYLLVMKLDDIDFVVTCGSTVVQSAAEPVKNIIPGNLP